MESDTNKLANYSSSQWFDINKKYLFILQEDINLGGDEDEIINHDKW